MKPAKGPGIARLAKTAAGVPIVPRMVDPVGYVSKTYQNKKGAPSLEPLAFLIYTYKTTSFCINFSLVPLFVAIRIYTPVRSPVITILSS